MGRESQEGGKKFIIIIKSRSKNKKYKFVPRIVARTTTKSASSSALWLCIDPTMMKWSETFQRRRRMKALVDDVVVGFVAGWMDG